MFLVIATATAAFAFDGSLHAGQNLEIRNLAGRVRVRNGSGDKLAVRAVRTSEHGDPSKVLVRVEEGPDGTVVCVRYPPNTDRSCGDRTEYRSGERDSNDVSVNFDVTVPRGVNVNAATVSGAVDVDTDARATASAVSGSVTITALEVPHASTVSGPVHATARGTSGDITVSSVSGNVRVSLPPGSGAHVSARSLSGRISAAGLPVERPRYGPGARANGALGTGGRSVTASTVSGSVTIDR